MRIRKGKKVMWVRDEWEVYVRSRVINRGSYMSVHGLLFLLNELGKRDKIGEACRAFYLFFATSLINSIILEHEC